MIVLNRTFSDHTLNKAVSDIFHATANVQKNNLEDSEAIDNIETNNTLATNSKLIQSLATTSSNINRFLGTFSIPIFRPGYKTGGYLSQGDALNQIRTSTRFNFLDELLSFKIVTSKFLKTYDKIQSKIWNESIQEDAFYTLTNYMTCFVGLLRTQDHFMGLKKLVDRMIQEGILDPSDAINNNDIMDLTELTKATTIMINDTAQRKVTLKLTKPMDVTPDVYLTKGYQESTLNPEPTEEQSYLKDKELYLLFVPSLPNYSTITKDTTNRLQPISDNRKIAESLSNWMNIIYSATGRDNYRGDMHCQSVYSQISASNGQNSIGWGLASPNDTYPLYRPFSFVKPKETIDPVTNKEIPSKWGKSFPATPAIIWRIGTPEQREEAISKGLPQWRIPDIIVDHVDRISHIDSLEMSISYDQIII